MKILLYSGGGNSVLTRWDRLSARLLFSSQQRYIKKINYSTYSSDA